MTRPWSFGFAENSSHKDGKVLKHVKCSLEGKRVCVGRHTGRLWDLCPHSGLNCLHGAFLLGFLWPIILICLVLSLYLAYLRVLLWVHVYLLAKMDSSEESYGLLDITLLLTSKELFSWGLLDFETEKYMVSYLFIWAGLSLSYLGVSGHREWTRFLVLCPSISCLTFIPVFWVLSFELQ